MMVLSIGFGWFPVSGYGDDFQCNSDFPVARLTNYVPPRPLPKIFRMTKKGRLDQELFEGATINTPSLLATEDFLAAHLDLCDFDGHLFASSLLCLLSIPFPQLLGNGRDVAELALAHPAFPEQEFHLLILQGRLRDQRQAQAEVRAGLGG